MSSFRETRLYKDLRCAREYLVMRTHPWGRRSLDKLGRLKDSQRGKRCFVIGNGPSLQQMDLSPLRDELTFGLNRIYLLFPEIGFRTSYLVAINRLVLEQVGSELLEFPGPLFVPWSARRYLTQILPANLHFVLTGCGKPDFHGDARGPLWSGATVTFVALQLAFHIGFEQVILVGVDHSFTTQGTAHSEVVSQGDDPDHFHPGYFGKGFRWQLPDLETSEAAYQLARSAYEAAGRKIIDATIGGKLQVFPKAEYGSLF
jgi:6-hydroxymethylpterin diphosphokinase MptE-like protein